MDNQIIDADSYQGSKEELNYKTIVLRHVERITRIPEKAEAIMVTNAYTLSIKILEDLLYPEFDKKAVADMSKVEAWYKTNKEKVTNKEDFKLDYHRYKLRVMTAFLSRQGYFTGGSNEEDEYME